MRRDQQWEMSEGPGGDLAMVEVQRQRWGNSLGGLRNKREGAVKDIRRLEYSQF